MNQPLISIGMPIYNPGQLLREAVLSILNQTHQNWELLIIDDQSTDQALENIQASGLLNDSRIKIYKNEQNIGLAASLNKCIELAKGEYFARMDQDDISMPDRFERQLAYLKEHPDVDLIATRVMTINSRGEITGSLPYALEHKDLCSKPWRSVYMPHPTWMGKLTWFKKYLYAQPAPYLCEDQELLLRAYRTSTFGCVNKALLHYRVRDDPAVCKLYKTYWSVLKMQLRHHVITRNAIHIPLSCAVFLGRLIKSTVAAIR